MICKLVGLTIAVKLLSVVKPGNPRKSSVKLWSLPFNEVFGVGPQRVWRDWGMSMFGIL
jgi:hypothetical protein